MHIIYLSMVNVFRQFWSPFWNKSRKFEESFYNFSSFEQIYWLWNSKKLLIIKQSSIVSKSCWFSSILYSKYHKMQIINWAKKFFVWKMLKNSWRQTSNFSSADVPHNKTQQLGVAMEASKTYFAEDFEASQKGALLEVTRNQHNTSNYWKNKMTNRWTSTVSTIKAA